MYCKPSYSCHTLVTNCGRGSSLSDTWLSGLKKKKQKKITHTRFNDTKTSHLTRSRLASCRHACAHTKTSYSHCFRSTWCYQTLPCWNQWSTLLWWKKNPTKTEPATVDPPPKNKLTKNVHEEWQIVVLVQFDTGMIACMFVCWVYVWIFSGCWARSCFFRAVCMFITLLLTHGRLTVMLVRGRRSLKKKEKNTVLLFWRLLWITPLEHTLE